MESKFEIAARTLYSRECEWALGGGPVREECLLTCTHYCESLLKAWKVTMVGTDCDDTVCHFKKVHTRNCSFKKNNLFFLQNSVSKVANWIIADILKYLY